MKLNSRVTCTCGGLYCSAKSLSMGFTLPHTRLVYDHLGPLSCKILKPPATLTTWTSILYVSLTDSLERQDATLLESRDGSGAGRGRVSLSYTHSRKKNPSSSSYPNPTGIKVLSHPNPHRVSGIISYSYPYPFPYYFNINFN